MPVFSYLAYPKQGAKQALLDELAALEYCEATPADNEEILILVTDTPDEKSEKALQKKIKKLKSLQSLGMTFGHMAE
jgi:nitrate reductase NapAB chaperone NapD